MVIDLPPSLDAPGRAAALADICARHGVARLALFGSAATPAFDPRRSDLDLLVEFRPDPPGGPFAAFFGLKEAIEALFGREVDLVEGPLARLRNPHFRRQVAAGLRPILAA